LKKAVAADESCLPLQVCLINQVVEHWKIPNYKHQIAGAQVSGKKTKDKT
jgi:hypothetical protein